MWKFLFLFIFSTFFFSCSKIDNFADSSKDSTGSFVGYKSKTFIPKSQIFAVSFDTIQPIKNIGKVFATEKYLLIGELNKGIHVFDNRNPSKPINSLFIKIPANIDFFLYNNFLIADNGNDLISIKVNLIEEVIDKARSIKDFKKLGAGTLFEIISRKEKQFRFPQFPNERNIFYECPDTTNGFVVEWEKAKLSKQPNCYR